jgi:hypothetical protein
MLACTLSLTEAYDRKVVDLVYSCVNPLLCGSTDPDGAATSIWNTIT